MKADRIQKKIETLDGWEIKEGTLVRTVELPTVRAAAIHASLVAEIGAAYERVPVVVIRGCYVPVRVSTSPEESVSERDVEMARRFSLGA